MFINIQSYSFSNIDKFSTAGLVTRLTTDVTNLQNAYQMLLRMCMRAPSSMICAMVMAFTINSRLARAFEEAKGMPEYDYILVNDQLEECVDRMHGIIQSQHDRAENCQEFIEKITEEIAVFQKGE